MSILKGALVRDREARPICAAVDDPLIPLWNNLVKRRPPGIRDIYYRGSPIPWLMRTVVGEQLQDEGP